MSIFSNEKNEDFFRVLMYIIDIMFYYKSFEFFISDKSNKVICLPFDSNISGVTVLFQVADLPVPFDQILPSSCKAASALFIVVGEI